MTRFEKMEGYPDEIQGRFNSFITTQFDDSLSVEMQIRSLIKWISSSRDLINDMVDYLNLFIEMFDERLQEEIVSRLNKWLADGTLAQIINNDVFNMKADKTYVDSEFLKTNNKMATLENEVDFLYDGYVKVSTDEPTNEDTVFWYHDVRHEENFSSGSMFVGNATVGSEKPTSEPIWFNYIEEEFRR